MKATEMYLTITRQELFCHDDDKNNHGQQYLNNTYSVSNWSDDIII